ncbi:hypothetical protein HMPREF1548_04483 [Clostridium sp. KLE 1755]|nr:hypothetical protein HMPREF1548_04483 [Clostridium sp. KLE 1755]
MFRHSVNCGALYIYCIYCVNQHKFFRPFTGISALSFIPAYY